ncbi:MAG: hypothetical protein JXM70_05275 [Pirellulales bacterium]|nr:hypothetical protein [Pirellulales bacterium]
MHTRNTKCCLLPRLNRLELGILLVIVVMLTGCGRNPLGRLAISGKVTLNGQPLEQGNIAFEPTNRQNGVASGTNIAAGSYSIPTEKGLPPGKYIVKIYSAIRPKTGSKNDEPGGTGNLGPAIQLIPPEYNSRSEHTVEVTSEGPNEFTFDVVNPKWKP